MDATVPNLRGIPLKYISLITLTFQNSAAILLMHYSRVMPGYTKDERFYPSTAVLMCECMKLVFCAAVDIKQRGLNKTIYDTFGPDHWKLSIPAILYAIQNNLQYVAVSNLPAATFQVMHQLKILSTAVFAVMMLRKRVTKMQWVSLFMLTAGIALIQVPKEAVDSILSTLWGETIEDDAGSGNSESLDEKADMNAMVGFLAVTTACTISGLAGVYFEKVLKTSPVSLWTRNVQLSLYSLVPAFIIGVVIKDGKEISQNGFFWGYNTTVWITIFFQAMGGIVIAIVVKYADNIAKNFATALAILVSFVASVYIFDFVITVNFILGAMTAIAASYLYSVNGVSESSSPAAYSKDPKDAVDAMELERSLGYKEEEFNVDKRE